MAKSKTAVDAIFDHDVFIAYSRRNKTFVDRLVRDLKDHHIRVWIDRLEIEVGDQTRQRIENAIDSSKYVALVISEASMVSFYVIRFELEAAFAKMIQTGRETFVLPLMRQRPKKRLPLMLSTMHYLDFMSTRTYMQSLHRLVRKITLKDDHFTGARLYKNVDTSSTGQMVGVGPISQVQYRGSCVRVFFHDGVIRTMETITDGKEEGVKSVIYDSQMRVSEIILFRNNHVIDSWRYIYDVRTGRRIKKLIVKPGCKPHLELTYDDAGNRLAEKHLS